MLNKEKIGQNTKPYLTKYKITSRNNLNKKQKGKTI